MDEKIAEDEVFVTIYNVYSHMDSIFNYIFKF